MEEKNPKERKNSPKEKSIGKRKSKKKASENAEKISEADSNSSSSNAGSLLSHQSFNSPDQNVSKEVLDQGAGNAPPCQNLSITGAPSTTPIKLSRDGASPYKKKLKFSDLNSPPPELPSTSQDLSNRSGLTRGNENSNSGSSQNQLEGKLKQIRIGTDDFYKKDTHQKEIQTCSSSGTAGTSSERPQNEGTSRQLFSPDSRALTNVTSEQSSKVADTSKGAISKVRHEGMSNKPTSQTRKTFSPNKYKPSQSFTTILEEDPQDSYENDELTWTYNIPTQTTEYSGVEYERQDTTSPILDPEQHKFVSGAVRTLKEAVNSYNLQIRNHPSIREYKDFTEMETGKLGNEEQKTTEDKLSLSPVAKGDGSFIVTQKPYSMMAIVEFPKSCHQQRSRKLVSPSKQSRMSRLPANMPPANTASASDMPGKSKEFEKNMPETSKEFEKNMPGTSKDSQNLPTFRMVPLLMLPAKYQFEMPPMNPNETNFYQRIFGINLGALNQSQASCISPDQPQSAHVPSIQHTLPTNTEQKLLNPSQFVGNQSRFSESSSVNLSPQKEARGSSTGSNPASPNQSNMVLFPEVRKRLNVYAKSSHFHINSPTGHKIHLGQSKSPIKSGESSLSHHLGQSKSPIKYGESSLSHHLGQSKSPIKSGESSLSHHLGQSKSPIKSGESSLSHHLGQSKSPIKFWKSSLSHHLGQSKSPIKYGESSLSHHLGQSKSPIKSGESSLSHHLGQSKSPIKYGVSSLSHHLGQSKSPIKSGECSLSHHLGQSKSPIKSGESSLSHHLGQSKSPIKSGESSLSHHLGQSKSPIKYGVSSLSHHLGQSKSPIKSGECSLSHHLGQSKSPIKSGESSLSHHLGQSKSPIKFGESPLSPKTLSPLQHSFFSSSQQERQSLSPTSSRSNIASPNRNKPSESYTVDDIMPFLYTPICDVCRKDFSPTRCNPCQRDGAISPNTKIYSMSPKTLVRLSNLSKESSRGLSAQVVQGPVSPIVLPPGFDLLPFQVHATIRHCKSCSKFMCVTPCKNSYLRREVPSPTESESSHSSPESPFKIASNLSPPGPISWAKENIGECKTKSPLRRVIRKINFSSIKTYRIIPKSKKSSRHSHEAEDKRSAQNVPGTSQEPDAEGQEKDDDEEQKCDKEN